MSDQMKLEVFDLDAVTLPEVGMILTKQRLQEPQTAVHTCPLCQIVHTGSNCPRCGHSRRPNPMAARVRRRRLNE